MNIACAGERGEKNIERKGGETGGEQSRGERREEEGRERDGEHRTAAMELCVGTRAQTITPGGWTSLDGHTGCYEISLNPWLYFLT